MMKGLILFVFTIQIFLVQSLMAMEPEPNDVGTSCRVEMFMTETIGPASLDSLQRAKKMVTENSCSSLVLLINTPGGSLPTTRRIVTEILNSPVPVLCLIYPSGAHAGSAGAIIMQACHVSGAMRATNMGAATPVSGSGQEIPKDLRKKLLNDTTSWLEGITKLRGRNKKFSQDIIIEAKAVSSEEAVRLKALDVAVDSKEHFFKFTVGRQVKLKDSAEATVVETSKVITFQPDLREKVLKLVADPQTAYVMFMGSLGLLYFEFTHPGMIVPGVVGAVGLVLSLISLEKLDVTWGGLLLILLGIAFLIAEAFVPSFGMLGIGGTVAFVVGSLFLFDESRTGYALPVHVILVTSLLMGAATMGIAYLAFSSRNAKLVGMYNDLVDHEATVKTVNVKNNKKAQVEILGEIWSVLSEEPLEVNQSVVVKGYKGLTLLVEPKV